MFQEDFQNGISSCISTPSVNMDNICMEFRAALVEILLGNGSRENRLSYSFRNSTLHSWSIVCSRRESVFRALQH